jgi:hypothetical protein
MRTVISWLDILRKVGQKTGPYLMLEILLPGGTLLALLLFLYRRRRPDIGRDAQRAIQVALRALASPSRTSLVPLSTRSRAGVTDEVLMPGIPGREKLDAVPDSECKACGDALRQSGHHIAAEALQSVHTATTVRVRNGKCP